MADYAGIDYGLGQSNVGEDGIRYGVIPAADLSEWVYENTEGVYLPFCPHCGNELSEDWDGEDNAVNCRDCFDSDEDWEEATDSGQLCPTCGKEIGDGDQYGEEADHHKWTGDAQYTVQIGSDWDLWVIKSPFYTHAQYCSPCAPGAGYLRTPCPTGPKTYCFGPEEFGEERPCPYPVYSVASGELLYSPPVST